jgi:hypothetical protein
VKASQIPAKIPVPFASGAGPTYVHTIPIASQIPITPGAASYTDGFVPLNFLPLNAGGIPPDGRDMNGILNAITQWLQWTNAGGLTKFDATFAAAIGGYPANAFLLNAAGTGFWLNTADDNSNNPDTGGAGWTSLIINPSTTNPLMDGIATPGTSPNYAREGHRHPTDTTRLAASYLSSDTGKVAAVYNPGGVTPGHIAGFIDANGTLTDLGAPGAARVLGISIANAGQTLGPGIYMVDTSGGAFSMYMPAAPGYLDTIELIDAAGTFVPNPLTLLHNGHTIMGSAEDLVCNVAGEDFRLWFNGAADWRLE